MSAGPVSTFSQIQQTTTKVTEWELLAAVWPELCRHLQILGDYSCRKVKFKVFDYLWSIMQL